MNKFASLIVIAVIGAIALSGLLWSLDDEGSTLRAFADDIIATCADADYRPTCYDVEIPKLMDRGLSMEEAFAVTRLIQNQDQEYPFCHVLGHFLSAKETAKDPSKWKEVIARAPSGICSNGAIHGAFQERFRAESLPDASVDELKAELSGICERREGWDPTRLEQATCTHALGHLMMYVTDAAIEKSLALCDEIAFNRDGYDMRQLCYDGVFMQIFQPLEPDDFSLIKGKEIETQEEARAFCATFNGSYRGSCTSESWPLFLKEIQTPDGLVAHCSVLRADSEEENRCFMGLVYVLTAIAGLDEEWVAGFCPFLPDARSGECFAHAASRILEVDWQNIDKAGRICSAAAARGVGDGCYGELVRYSTYNFKHGSEEFHQLCESLPTAWKEQCLRQPPR